MHYDQFGFISGKGVCLHTDKNEYSLLHKEKKIRIITVDAKKAIARTEYSCMIKPFSKVEIEKNCFY